MILRLAHEGLGLGRVGGVVLLGPEQHVVEAAYGFRDFDSLLVRGQLLLPDAFHGRSRRAVEVIGGDVGQGRVLVFQEGRDRLPSVVRAAARLDEISERSQDVLHELGRRPHCSQLREVRFGDAGDCLVESEASLVDGNYLRNGLLWGCADRGRVCTGLGLFLFFRNVRCLRRRTLLRVCSDFIAVLLRDVELLLLFGDGGEAKVGGREPALWAQITTRTAGGTATKPAAASGAPRGTVGRVSQVGQDHRAACAPARAKRYCRLRPDALTGVTRVKFGHVVVEAAFMPRLLFGQLSLGKEAD